MKFKISALLLTFISSIAHSSVLIDVPEIVGKDQKAVSEILGQPTKCSESKYGEKCIYAIAETEIIFIDGKADWITIEGIDDIPFNNDALESIGITSTMPNFKNNYTLRWSIIEGLIEVSIFKGVKNSDYVSIKAYTK